MTNKEGQTETRAHCYTSKKFLIDSLSRSRLIEESVNLLIFFSRYMYEMISQKVSNQYRYLHATQRWTLVC